MSRYILVSLAVAIVALTVLWSDASAVPDPGRDKFADRPDSGIVVVELFTSQGCSSCPSADRLLSRLGWSATGVEVIPLAYHVDYWNYIGWTDPFSSPVWSKRQQDYAQVLPGGRLYTPQLVIQGASHCVGSDSEKVRGRIDEAARRAPQGQVRLAVDRASAAGKLEVEVSARSAGAPLDLMLALFESGLLTSIDRGENADRTLHNDYVVRRLEKILSLDGEASQWRTRRVALDLDPGWKLEGLGVAAFLQDPDSLSIHGAAVARPSTG